METQMVELSPNIHKNIIKKGRLSRKPSLGWTCYVSLSSENDTEEEVTIGNGSSKKERLIERCIESMQLEEESLFLLKLNESSVWSVNITLNSYKEKPYIFEWTEEEKIEACNFYKSRGAELFKENQIEEAFFKFSTALKLLLLTNCVLEEESQNPEVNNLRVALYNNLAGCQLYFKNFPHVVKLCNDSINILPSAKALYRRALAYIEFKEYEKAEADLVNLLKIEPKNKVGLEKYKLVRELDKSNRENYKNVVKNMFRLN